MVLKCGFASMAQKGIGMFNTPQGIICPFMRGDKKLGIKTQKDNAWCKEISWSVGMISCYKKCNLQRQLECMAWKRNKYGGGCLVSVEVWKMQLDEFDNEFLKII